ncbi:hypothetical protein ElyMa_002766100 [Elysia marginata]|uniref:Ig-like domain-containing protein n=1 Tax=Elysia marginata TaxID=1093978 RepID=A0AAV4HNJ2_9GAST|nr:hypothetical protein ElyMa_002766100 [Elysia marginata]
MTGKPRTGLRSVLELMFRCVPTHNTQKINSPTFLYSVHGRENKLFGTDSNGCYQQYGTNRKIMDSASKVALINLLLIVVDSVGGCGPVLEGTTTAVTCTTKPGVDFTSIGVQVKLPSGASQQLSVCYKNNSCSDNQPNAYKANLNHYSGQGNSVMLLKIGSVSRDDSHIQCTVDGIVSGQCILDVYVDPDKPVCQPPKFIQNGTTTFLQCTADNVYPSARCHFTAQGVVEGEQTVHVSHRESTLFPGNKEVTCELRVPVRGHSAGDYLFRAAVQPDVPFRLTGDHFVQGDEISLKLSEVALEESHSDNMTFEIKKGSDLRKTLHITGNPPPNRFSLTMRPEKDATALTVLDKDHTISYGSGSLQLQLRDVGRSGSRFGYYTFRAGNDVGGLWPQLEYKFILQEKYNEPSPSPSPVSGESDGGLGLPAVIGIVVGAALFIIIVVIVICYLKMIRRRKAEERPQNGNFDHPYPASGYIYPNMAFEPTRDDQYNQAEKPPPYAEEDYTEGIADIQAGLHAITD